jgi:leader peptidase (prepilin peptidase) / N-methyltransferase
MMHMLPIWIWIGWFFLLGSVIGSFLNVVIYRVPRGISIAWPPSHCPACNHRIRWHDNVPIVSWLLLRGRCRDCKAHISVRYPLIEAITGIVFALVSTVMLLYRK